MHKKFFALIVLLFVSLAATAGHGKKEQEQLPHCSDIGVTNPTVKSAYYVSDVYNPTQWMGLRTRPMYIHKHQHTYRHCVTPREAHVLKSGRPYY